MPENSIFLLLRESIEVEKLCDVVPALIRQDASVLYSLQFELSPFDFLSNVLNRPSEIPTTILQEQSQDEVRRVLRLLDGVVIVLVRLEPENTIELVERVLIHAKMCVLPLLFH